MHIPVPYNTPLIAIRNAERWPSTRRVRRRSRLETRSTVGRLLNLLAHWAINGMCRASGDRFDAARWSLVSTPIRRNPLILIVPTFKSVGYALAGGYSSTTLAETWTASVSFGDMVDETLAGMLINTKQRNTAVSPRCTRWLRCGNSRPC